MTFPRAIPLCLLLFSACPATMAEEPAARAVAEPWRYSAVQGRGWAEVGRFSAYTTNGPLLLDRRLRERKPATWDEALAAYGPAWVSPLSGAGTMQWCFDDGMAVSGGSYPSSLEAAITGEVAQSRHRIISNGTPPPAPKDEAAEVYARMIRPEDKQAFLPIPREGRFAAYLAHRPVVLAAKLRERMPKTFAETLEIFGPGWIDATAPTGPCRWWFEDGVECSIPGLPWHLADAVTWNAEKRVKVEEPDESGSWKMLPPLPAKPPSPEER